MAITTVNGWRVSNGDCYATKDEAYRAEMKVLYEKLEIIAKGSRTFTNHGFAKKVAEVQQWLQSCRAVVEDLGGEHEASVQAALTAVENWLKDGQALVKTLANEPDQNVTVALSQQ